MNGLQTIKTWVHLFQNNKHYTLATHKKDNYEKGRGGGHKEGWFHG